MHPMPSDPLGWIKEFCIVKEGLYIVIRFNFQNSGIVFWHSTKQFACSIHSMTRRVYLYSKHNICGWFQKSWKSICSGHLMRAFFLESMNPSRLLAVRFREFYVERQYFKDDLSRSKPEPYLKRSSGEEDGNSRALSLPPFSTLPFFSILKLVDLYYTPFRLSKTIFSVTSQLRCQNVNCCQYFYSCHCHITRISEQGDNLRIS